MGKGLPKKYAKMGFKKGWIEYKKTSGWRKAHGLKGGTKATKKSSPTKKSPKSSGGRSNPSGGARTTPGLGAIWRGLRTGLNVIAAALNPFSRPESQYIAIDDKIRQIVMNYSGYDYSPFTTGERWEWDRMAPTYQGIAVSMVNEWFDRKTRKSTKISKGKVVHILTEAIPAITAHMDARQTEDDYMWSFLDSYNKHTDGYSIKTHTWDFGRVELYAGAKAVAWAYDKIVPSSYKSALNRVFPKGVNPF